MKALGCSFEGFVFVSRHCYIVMVHQRRIMSISSSQRSYCESYDSLRPLRVKIVLSKPTNPSLERLLTGQHGKRFLINLEANEETSGAAHIQCVLSNRVHAYHQIDSWDVLVIGTKEGTFVALRKPVDQVGKSNCVLTPQHLSDNNCGLLSSNLDKFFLYTIFDVTSAI